VRRKEASLSLEVVDGGLQVLEAKNARETEIERGARGLTIDRDDDRAHQQGRLTICCRGNRSGSEEWDAAGCQPAARLSSWTMATRRL